MHSFACYAWPRTDEQQQGLLLDPELLHHLLHHGDLHLCHRREQLRVCKQASTNIRQCQQGEKGVKLGERAGVKNQNLSSRAETLTDLVQKFVLVEMQLQESRREMLAPHVLRLVVVEIVDCVHK